MVSLDEMGCYQTGGFELADTKANNAHTPKQSLTNTNQVIVSSTLCSMHPLPSETNASLQPRNVPVHASLAVHLSLNIIIYPISLGIYLSSTPYIFLVEIRRPHLLHHLISLFRSDPSLLPYNPSQKRVDLPCHIGCITADVEMSFLLEKFVD